MLLKNKKGQFGSTLLVVLLIFIVAIIIFFSNHIFSQFYQKVADTLEDTGYNNTEAHTVVQDIRTAENSTWDYAILAIVIGLIIQLVILSFSTRIMPALYWIYILESIVILIVGSILSVIWVTMAENPEFADTILRFPITDIILGNTFMFLITGIIVLGGILLFGKGFSGGEP